ncbi:UPF0711 protein C18orf21 homolog isoform X4 [Lutra lutra]|uniref:UPF0711 protein C18orf21 homolog isoform X4 n=1 Tax=Lutra lutra TaxID=9657 RepID=UPI001FD174D3|nr:UPF0711 protein C18orf21 homolog isoform X4 [Lutra lutra]
MQHLVSSHQAMSPSWTGSAAGLLPAALLRSHIHSQLSRQNANITFEGTCPYCFQLLVLDNSRLTTCKTCNRTVKHHGKSRSFLSALKSSPTTPTSKLSLKTPERKTPSSANLNPKCGSKGKSPALIFRTPTSGQSTPTCSSKNVSKTKKHFSQLKMLLSRSESQKNSKVDFRNFLLSL